VLARCSPASLFERWAVIIGCACGNARRLAAARTAGETFVYDYTAPSGAVDTFATPLEAKRAVRQNGGGTVRRRTVKTDTGA
jgi:hypothetical protein